MDLTFLDTELAGLSYLAWLELLGITAVVALVLSIIKRVVF